MTKKIFGANAISHLIYGLLMLFPFLSILSRSAYVTINKNAFESYNGSIVNITATNITSVESLLPNNTYELSVYTDQEVTTSHSSIIRYSYFSIVDELISADSYFESIRNADGFSVGGGSNNWSALSFYNGTTLLASAWIVTRSVQSYGHPMPSNLISKTHTFTYVSRSNNNNLPFGGLKMLVPTYEDTLDNAFDYSVKKFVENDNLGQLNFFTFFDGMFVNRDGVTGLYLNFANWYLNYALLVSAVYILFLVLLWFVNFARKLLDGRNSFGHGGF